VRERERVLINCSISNFNGIFFIQSALKLTEVVKEREAQIELKKMLEKMHKEREEQEHKRSTALLAEQFKEEIELDTKKAMEKKKLADYHRAQIAKHVEQINKAKKENDQEGEMIRKLNQQYAYELEQLEEVQAMRARELKQTYDKSIETKQKIFEAERAMDEEENDEIRVYADAKRKMIKMRREKEIELWKEKQDNREKMIAHLGNLLKTQEEDEDSRIAKAIEKREMKLALEEREKLEKLKEMQDSIAKHRLETIDRNKSRKAQEQKDIDDYVKQKLEADRLFQLYEEEKTRQRFKKGELFAKKNLNQAVSFKSYYSSEIEFLNLKFLHSFFLTERAH
jgi:hypothetical protein